MKILVLGAGAVGGYFGGRLIEINQDVTFLVREKRKKYLDKKEINIFSPHGNFSYKPKLIVKGEPIINKFDLVFIACKAYDLNDAISGLSEYIKKDSVLIPLLNGIKHISYLKLIFGENIVWGGFCHLAVKMKSYNIIHSSKYHKLLFGSIGECKSREIIKKEDIILNIISLAKFDTRIPENIMQHMWNKFIYISVLSGITCFFKSKTGPIIKTKCGKNTLYDLLKECTLIANKSKFPIKQSYIQKKLEILLNDNLNLSSSTYEDMVSEGRIESEQIIGDMVNRGRYLELNIPILEMILCHLRIYESNRKV